MEQYHIIELDGELLLQCFDFWDFKNDKNKIERLIKDIEYGTRRMFAVKLRV